MTGKQFSYPMTADMVSLSDIARSLSNQCRFAGHLKRDRWYSVAEHSVNVADWIYEETKSKESAFAALFHDASETYLVDVPKPIKPYLEGYKEIEQQVTRIIEQVFGIHPGQTGDALIKEADCRLLIDERAELCYDYDLDWDLPYDTGLGVTIIGLVPCEAEDIFIDAFGRYAHD
jgi:hypothetical protein